MGRSSPKITWWVAVRRMGWREIHEDHEPESLEEMRILVVEDDKKVASFLEKGLREEGYSVDVAHDGDDGVLKARVHDYDLLVLDVMLPGRSGLEIVKECADQSSIYILKVEG